MKQINEQFAIETGTTANGQKVTTLYKTHVKMQNDYYEKERPDYIKAWYFTPDTNDKEVTEEEIMHEIELNDWSRWNEDLKPGDKYEISEAIYYDMLGALPPRRRNGNYFEVGEPHHHLNNGKPIHRACWMENDKYFTGYPKI